MATYPRESNENLQGQFIKPVSLPAVKMPGARSVPVRVSLVAQSRVGTVMGCPPVPITNYCSLKISCKEKRLHILKNLNSGYFNGG